MASYLVCMYHAAMRTFFFLSRIPVLALLAFHGCMGGVFLALCCHGIERDKKKTMILFYFFVFGFRFFIVVTQILNQCIVFCLDEDLKNINDEHKVYHTLPFTTFVSISSTQDPSAHSVVRGTCLLHGAVPVRCIYPVLV